MKNILLIITSFFLVGGSIQSVNGQNRVTLKGNFTDYENQQILPGVRVTVFNGKDILETTDTNVENGAFSLSLEETFEKIKFSYPYYYPLIIENLNRHEGKNLDLGTLQLIEIPFSFTRYVSKKAEREDKKQSKHQLKKWREGIIINSDDRNYVMRLKKKSGEYSFYIDYKEFKKE
ncbi:MAG: hypothetical protein GW839_00485 [Flavobacteriales bacterium]|nr:hypothetical protein [Flavobacteriales bacterium]NCP85042.1 hypothetical protein [Bacteroidota bacterium]PIQ17427.1 MAG: hypothetical protein COW66_11820 [Flavobacteriaceae bacterium CG18_big_fil_WC_8_21_14_2_50_34_36]